MNPKFQMDKFDHIDYLKTGSLRQQSVYKILTDSNVMSILDEYTPILTGTFPINIDVANSDLDILCYMHSKDTFILTLNQHFSTMKGYKLTSFNQNGYETVISNFTFQGMEFEIFGQNRPVKEQNAYRHMINEYRILSINDDLFRQRIIELKEQGIKTEPAFAMVLGLEGDPYQAMLDID